MIYLKLRSLGRTAGALLLFLALAGAFVRPAAVEVKDAKTEEEMAALLKARVAVARKGYDATAKGLGEVKRLGAGLNILVVKPEEVYAWSVRLLQAERDLKPKPVDQIAALEDHLKRITELEKKVKDLVPVGLLLPSAGFDAEWYRLEAELWLAQAKAKK